MAINLATLTFNKGLCSLIPLFEKLGDDEVGQYTVRYFVERDKKHIKDSQLQALPAAKARRKVRHEARKAKEKQLLKKKKVT